MLYFFSSQKYEDIYNKNYKNNYYIFYWNKNELNTLFKIHHNYNINRLSNFRMES